MLPPNCSVVPPKDVGQFAVLVVEGSAYINGRDDSPVTAGHIIGLANLLATDRAIVDARYPPPDVRAGPNGLTYLIVTVSIIIKTCSLVERHDGDSDAGTSMCQMLNDAATMLLPRCREMLIRGLHRMNISSGEVLFRRNDPATSIYLIVSGRLRTSRPPTAVGDKIETDGLLGIPRNDRTAGRSPQVQDYGRNEVIGMKEVILGNPRTQDAFCVRDVELVEMSRQSLHSCIKENPSIIWKLSKQHQESAQLVNIGVLPINDSVKTEEFVEELRLALTAILSRDTEGTSGREPTGSQGVGVIRLDDAKDNALDFQNSNDRSRAARWIFQQEEMMRFVILPFFDPAEVSQHRLPGHVKENWASIASSQCDIIFVVATPNCSHEVTSREKQLLKHAPHAIIELIMLHHPNPLTNECDPPKGTRRWILPRRNACDRDASFKYDLHGHHHVRMDRLHCRPGLNVSGASAALRTMSLLRQDVQRIARRISGRSVALVLSGGGSRGLAHLGVIRALEDNGIPIDVIGGTSQGAFMAASFALSVDSSKMQLRVERFAKYIGRLV
jgi:lysophospholipid hydrolase